MTDLQTSFQGQRLLIQNLPTLPAALQEAMLLADSPHTGIAQLAAVIERDQALAGNVLKRVNSPFYGFPGRISSVHNALALLGFNIVKNLIISTLVFESLIGSMTALWRHSVGCSIACCELGRLLQVKEADTLVLAGLLHDIGKAVTAAQLPEAKKAVTRLVDEEDLPYQEAEQRVLGMRHTRIGDWLAEHWHLPENLRHVLACHHQLADAKDCGIVTAVVHVGDFLTRLFEVGSGGDDHVPTLNPQVFQELRLNRQKLSMAIDAIGERFEQEKVASFWQAPEAHAAPAGGGMQKIPLHQATPGMVLVYGVITNDGRILASAGSPVDDAMLRRLELAGTTKLVVQGKPVPGAGMGYNAQARADRLEHLFRAHQDDRFMKLVQAGLYRHFRERA